MTEAPAGNPVTGNPPTFRLPGHILFGAAYYAEYQPEPRLKADLDLMVEGVLSVIRVGESVWSTWEPDDGVFDLEWMAEILDGAAERSISVVLGTPTYAIPPWLTRRYPEVMAERASGRPIAYGHRQNVDYSHPAFRYHAERVVRRIVARYADHPAVIGYQVDNEPGMELFHNHGAFQGFLSWLKVRYGSVEEVNRRWGLTYWSHRLRDWSDLWLPDGNTTQGYDLAWRRYQAELTTDFIGWQAGIVREYAREDQFVTTCLAHGRPGTDDRAVAAALDLIAANPYYPMQDAFTRPPPQGARQGLAPSWARANGSWWLFYESDLRRGTTAGPWLVTETNAGSIGESWSNYPAYDGQWRQAAWTLVSRGARMVEYWHWHTLHYGAETYWGGVLGHTLAPGRTFAEVARIGHEFAAAGDTVTGLLPDVDVAFLYSVESRWALQFQPALALPGTSEADPDTYGRVFGAFYRAFNEAGRQAAIGSPDDLVADPANFARRFPVLVAPVLYVAADDLLAALRDYVAAGGHLIATFRTGYVDEEGQVRHEVAPAALRPAAGASYLEYSNLSVELPLAAGDDPSFEVGLGATATGWADGLTPEGAAVLATYRHPHFGRWAAITTNRSGRGRLTWVGTLPDDATLQSLARWAVPEPANAAWRDLPPSVTVTGAARGMDAHLSFVTNWSGDPVTVLAPHSARDLLSGFPIDAGDPLALGPWDLRVLADDLPDQTPSRGAAPRPIASPTARPPRRRERMSRTDRHQSATRPLSRSDITQLSRRALLAGVPATGLAAFLASCSGGSSSSGGGGGSSSAAVPSADLAAELKKPAELTFWSWTPGTQAEVNMFMKAYPNIKVKLVNAGQGTPQYTKLRTALKAGSGAPDNVQIEFQYIPTFSLQNNLLDMSKYGADASVKDQFVEWTWNQAAPGGKVFGIPWDSGPMGLLYRKDIFDKYGITVPKTWADFATQGQKLHKAAPNVSMTNLASTNFGAFISLMWQAGSRPFSALDANGAMKLQVNDENAKKVADFFDPLVKSGVVSTDADFNNDWYQGLASGRYATWFSAAWGPIFLQGSAAKSAGKWRAAPLPQWDAAKPVSGNWGGSTIAVTAKTKYPAAATAFAVWMMTNAQTSSMFSKTQFLFPTVKKVLADPTYVDQKLPFYGGQEVNKVFAAIAQTVSTDFEWDPFHDYLDTTANTIFGKALSSKSNLSVGLDALQANLTTYAKAQGIKLKT